ncbi:MAG: EAL domain-containing protein [Nitrospirota bacterium]
MEHLRIVLIEDNPGDARLIRELLSESRTTAFETVSAGSLAAGMDLLAGGEFDLVLLDLGLPDSRGFGSLATIHERWPDIPVIILTGLADEELAVKAVQMSAQDYLVKGHVESELLVRSIRYALERKRVQRELERISTQNALILESAAEGIFGVDTGGNFTFVNTAAARMLGYEVDELIGRHSHPLCHGLRPDGSPYAERECIIYKTIREGTPQTSSDDVFVRKDGAVFPVEYTSMPLIEHGRVTGAVVTFRDIAERKRAEQAIRESEEKYRELVQNASSIIIKVDRQGRITFFNEFAQTFYGYAENEVAGKTLVETLAPYSDMATRDIAAMVDTALANPREYHRSESETMRKSGERSWVSWTTKAILNRDGAVTGVLVVGQDISERKRMEDAMWRQAYHDILTDLPNRMLFLDHLKLALTQARRNSYMLAVMFLDLDRFKAINDSLGHVIGDRLLQAVAYRMNSVLRQGDTVARIGGDEYTILLPQVMSEADVVKIVRKLLAEFQQPFTVDDHVLHITASIGISLYPADGNDEETLLKNADIAMYHAKGQGRNNYQFYNPSMNVRILERIILENSLRHTLERGELTLFYQPQVRIDSRRIVCAEALIRWNHPDLGLLSPAHFIPIAEETGLIVPIGEWVLKTACEQNVLWQRAGLPSLCVTVNLSARQFQQPELADIVDRILRETGLDPRWLELEITESTAMQNLDITVPNLVRLNGMGVKVAIDDFGTGYSSLSYLKKLPIQKLKIDKSFISGLTVDPDYEAIVNAVIGLAHNLKMRVIAEGVETEAQLSFLHSSNCDEMQGFLFSEPLPPREFEELTAVCR